MIVVIFPNAQQQGCRAKVWGVCVRESTLFPSHRLQSVRKASQSFASVRECRIDRTNMPTIIAVASEATVVEYQY